jgi:DNA repair protein RadC
MLLKDRIESVSDTELLALLLGSRRTAEVLLRKASGSLFALLHEGQGRQGDLFCSQDSRLYSDPTSRLHAARELAARAIREELIRGGVFSNPAKVREFLIQRLGGLEYEVFVVLFLNAQNQLLEVSEMFRGTLTQTSVYPREIVKAALAFNAAGVIFAHNHPSGMPEPSSADQRLTACLQEALAMVDVKVLDHFIIAGTKTLSFAERGLL